MQDVGHFLKFLQTAVNILRHPGFPGAGREANIFYPGMEHITADQSAADLPFQETQDSAESILSVQWVSQNELECSE
ncbi:MAG: hypothetical protein Fur0035_12110 [Anaerolineales bacterium]